MISQELTIPVAGGSMQAYLSRPVPESGPHPAVIVLQEIYGVNAEMRRVTDLLPTSGYVGLAINYYHRTHPDLNSAYNDEGRRTGMEAASHVTRAGLREDLAAAVAWLNAQDFVKHGKVATLGFCFGGTVAFLSATMDGICGAVSYYGSGIARPWGNGEPEGLADADAIKAPVLIILGEEDESIPAEAVRRVCDTLDDRGPGCQIQIYKNVGHAFFRSGAPGASPHVSSDEALAEAVGDSWNLTQTFLKRAFAGAPSSTAKV